MIKLIVLNEVSFFDRVNFVENQVEGNTNRVNVYHSRIDSEHN